MLSTGKGSTRVHARASQVEKNSCTCQNPVFGAFIPQGMQNMTLFYQINKFQQKLIFSALYDFLALVESRKIWSRTLTRTLKKSQVVKNSCARWLPQANTQVLRVPLQAIRSTIFLLLKIVINE